MSEEKTDSEESKADSDEPGKKKAKKDRGLETDGADGADSDQ